MIPKAQLLCTPMLNQISETVLGEVEKDSFAALQSKGDTQQVQCPQNLVSSLGEGRSFIVIVRRGNDQSMAISSDELVVR